MAVESSQNLSTAPFILSGEAYYESATLERIIGRTTPLKQFTLLAKKILGAGTPVADGANTGNGTVTGFGTLPQQGGILPMIGNYLLECTGLGGDGRSVGAVTPNGGNTGNGTVTGFAVVSGEKPEVGNWNLECVETDANGAKSAVITPTGGNTGDGAAGAVTPGTKAIEGNYLLTCITAAANAGIFEVIDPNGTKLKNLTVGVAYSTTHFGVTIADGAADFIVGDSFTIAMTIAHGGRFKLVDPNGVALTEDILMPGTTGGTVVVTSGGVTFTITDGATDFVSGDKFTLVIAASQGGVFKLTDPATRIIAADLVMSGVASGSTTFREGGLVFTVTDGATDFIVGDKFTLPVVTIGKYVPLDKNGAAGVEKVSGIYLGDEVTAAAIAAADVGSGVYVLKTEALVDDALMTMENSYTLDTVLPSGKTIREELQDIDIHCRSNIGVGGTY